MPHVVVLCGEFLLHAPCCFMCGVSLIHPMLFYVGEFLLHTPCCFMWGVALTHHLLFYAGSLSYTPHAILCGEFLLHGPFFFMWGITHSVLFYVVGFFYMTGTFFLQEVCFKCHILFDIRNFSYTPYASFHVGRFSNSMPCVLSCEEFLLYSPCCFMWEVSLTILHAMY